jgi:hypothetical protein
MSSFRRWPANEQPDDGAIAVLVVEADGNTTIIEPGGQRTPTSPLPLDDAVAWAGACGRPVYVSLQDGAIWPAKYQPLIHRAKGGNLGRSREV